jgi:hypothetical protein
MAAKRLKKNLGLRSRLSNEESLQAQSRNCLGPQARALVS